MYVHINPKSLLNGEYRLEYDPENEPNLKTEIVTVKSGKVYVHGAVIDISKARTKLIRID